MSPPLRLYRTSRGIWVERDGRFHPVGGDWSTLIDRPDLEEFLRAAGTGPGVKQLHEKVLAPVSEAEVWAAGVTYERSREARMEESREAGGGSFYDKVYDAERPELFFKAAAWRVRGPGDEVRVRGDAEWSVPEPEVALCINSRGTIVGFTIGNDVSSRDIEGANPLYLPQAKTYDGSCALGPAMLVASSLPRETRIAIEIRRRGAAVFSGETAFARMRRPPELLVEYLYRETSFPRGCVLLTGTGIVPPDDVRLLPGDQISIDVASIGRLENVVAAARQRRD